MNKILYKYLDINGGLMMLKHHNLQFTNATKFNDPFDCHPALFDYSHAPMNEHNWPPADFISLKEENDMLNLRNKTWLCCLSKVYDSLLMWAYYNNHKGICIGLNTDAVLKSCNTRCMCMLFPFAREVIYKELSPKPDYFKDHPSWMDMLVTKAKEWEHEQEVRIITTEPQWLTGGRDIPDELKNDEIIDFKEIRHYPEIASECFESVYLGVNILPCNKTQVINLARNLNPNIQIYQMDIDPNAFKLKCKLLT